INIRAEPSLEASHIEIWLFEVPTYTVQVLPNYIAGASPRECRARANVHGSRTVRPWDGRPATVVQREDLPALREAGIETWDPRGVLVLIVDRIFQRHADMFVGVDEVASAAVELHMDIEAVMPHIPGTVRKMRE